MGKWVSSIRKKHKKGKKIHQQEKDGLIDIFILPFVISALLFFPLMAFADGLHGSMDWLGAILFLLYLSLSIYGYHTILGFMNG